MGWRDRVRERQDAERRQIAFSNGRQLQPGEPFTTSPLLPEGYVWTGNPGASAVRHQRYHSIIARNTAREIYQRFINNCIRTCRPLSFKLQRIVDVYLEKVRRYKDEDTIASRQDPNDNIFLTLYLLDNLTTDLINEAGETTNIKLYIQELHAAKSELEQLLPANYSSPWHLESYTQRLISNSSGYYYDP